MPGSSALTTKVLSVSRTSTAGIQLSSSLDDVPVEGTPKLEKARPISSANLLISPKGLAVKKSLGLSGKLTGSTRPLCIPAELRIWLPRCPALSEDRCLLIPLSGMVHLQETFQVPRLTTRTFTFRGRSRAPVDFDSVDMACEEL
ncbi:MAG: hypothetical protein DMG30_11025 [Acidobacteria bacterium]|nr:MAG: hypothetical protein DMG30_11025 [Acidobacteriota bacterium]